MLTHHYAWSNKEFEEFSTSCVKWGIILRPTLWSTDIWHRNFDEDILCCLLEVSCPILNLIVFRSSDFALKCSIKITFIWQLSCFTARSKIVDWYIFANVSESSREATTSDFIAHLFIAESFVLFGVTKKNIEHHFPTKNDRIKKIWYQKINATYMTLNKTNERKNFHLVTYFTFDCWKNSTSGILWTKCCGRKA